jgi:putative ABC transport system ATP-binding protein
VGSPGMSIPPGTGEVSVGGGPENEIISTVRSTGTPLLEVRGITKGYREGDREHVVLRGADATVGSGEFVALLGPSGSGKSTLLNLVSGIDAPDHGEVVVAGTSLTGLTERDRTLFRRRHVGFVFQFFNLLPTLTVEENLLLPLEFKGRVGAPERERARTLLNAVGLMGREGSYPDRLSGGEQQRVAVARALVHDPILVLADEPTGNLDAETGSRVLDLLAELAGSRGRALLVVTHSREVADRAHRILRIRDGLLVEDGKPPQDETHRTP